ncbi:MAG: PDDEXK nuclease domain-containing protein, partial [Coriobacteriales bacterium]|nr:PDDEXK nuclease domain-containing protein [Coriobacteriales bacterium]
EKDDFLKLQRTFVRYILDRKEGNPMICFPKANTMRADVRGESMSKEKQDGIEHLALIANDIATINETALFERVSAIIENRKSRAGAYANREVTLMYWEIGKYVDSVLLGGERAEYGKKILATLSRQLSWSHFKEILPLKSEEARMYYASDAMERNYGVRELRHQISRKAYERREIANTELSAQSAVPFNVFKDPFLLDILGLKENFLEADLEKAILTELEAFILEFGNGFTFVKRQKHMDIDGDEIVLDLLFYNRILRRLVAVDLKIGRFKAAYKSQMELYLKWLDLYERKPNEEAPIGIILCATANRKTIEMLEMDKAGIAVAEYWTTMPPKALFEEKIRSILAEAQERLERRKSLPPGGNQEQVDYFYEPKDDEDE